MTMTAHAAARSPMSRVRSDSNEAEMPVAKRTGEVPRPKRAIVQNPAAGFWVVAAFAIMAQDSMHGRNPAPIPSRNLDPVWLEEKSGGKIRPKKDPAERDGREKRDTGKILRMTRPNRIIRIPAPRVTPLRNPAKIPGNPAMWARAAARAPSREYVRIRPV